MAEKSNLLKTDSKRATEVLSVAMMGSRGFYVRQSGLETHVRELARLLASRGHHVTVYGRRTDQFAIIPAELLADTGVEVVDGLCSKGKFTATLVNTVWATFKALRSKRFDVLHYHGVGCVFAVLLAKLGSLPVVLTLHSTNWEERKWSGFSGWLIHKLECKAVRAADAVISVSQAIGVRTQDEYGVTSCVTAPGSGVFLQEDLGRDDEVLESLGLEKGKYILFAGRVIADKGCHLLLEAFNKADLPIKLVIAGPIQDPVYCESLKANGDSRLVIPGVLSDEVLGSLYRWCWVFSMASMTEGLPIALIDAMAHGVPCLVSDIPGHRQLVTDPQMRFTAGDASDLLAKLQRLSSSLGEADAEARAEVGASWLEQHPEYSFEAVGDRTLKTYERVRQLTARSGEKL